MRHDFEWLWRRVRLRGGNEISKQILGKAWSKATGWPVVGAKHVYLDHRYR